MLVIHRRGSCCGGMGRYYHGSGMFGEMGRKLFSSGIKKAISSGPSSAIAHKVADAVVNGATSSSAKKVADAIIKEGVSAVGKASANILNTAIDSVVNKVKKKKRPHPVVQQHHSEAYSIAVPSSPPLKRKKIDIDSLIDGSGIVYD